MSKHTTGPWYVSKRNPRLVIESGPRGNSIAKTGVNLGVCSQEQAEANARLIAAAPELLDALKAFLRAPSVGSDAPGSLTIVVQDFNLKAARAAIAQAEGGEA